jgi:hypothetical protein
MHAVPTYVIKYIAAVHFFDHAIKKLDRNVIDTFYVYPNLVELWPRSSSKQVTDMYIISQLMCIY